MPVATKKKPSPKKAPPPPAKKAPAKASAATEPKSPPKPAEAETQKPVPVAEAAKPSPIPTTPPPSPKPAKVLPIEGRDLRAICDRAELAAALRLCGSAVPKKTNKAVLEGIHIAAGNDRLTLRSTDLETWIRTEIATVQIEKSGLSVLPAERIAKIVGGMKEDSISLEAAGDKAWVKGERSQFQIFTQDPADYPPTPTASDAGVKFSLPWADLRRALLRVETAAKRDGESTRYAYKGVLLELKNGKLAVAATDGRRLALEILETNEPKAKVATAILPVVAIKYAGQLGTDAEGEEVEIGVWPGHACLSVGPTTIGTVILEGQFPPYADIMPRDMDKKLTASRESLATAFAQSLHLVTEATNSVALQLDAKGVRVSTRAKDVGAAVLDVPCKYEGGDLAIGANPKFMLEAIASAADEVSVEFSAANRPLVVRGGGTYVVVVMPVNLES